MQVFPSADAVAETYAQGAAQVVWTTLVADLETPVSAFLKIAGGKPMSFLLESVEGGAVRGRYSIIGFDPDIVWRTNSAHQHAVEMSPQLYTGVRIYNGHLPAGVAGSRAIEIDSTKYWDYEIEPTWKAIRVFDPPLTRVRRQEPHLD